MRQHAVDADDDQFARVALEDASGERAAGAALEVQAREADNRRHTFFNRRHMSWEFVVFFNSPIGHRKGEVHKFRDTTPEQSAFRVQRYVQWC